MITRSPIAAWREYGARYRLEGSRCTGCQRLFFPKKHQCSCGVRMMAAHIFKPEGELISFSHIVQPTGEYKEQGCLIIGFITLSEGPTIVAQITDVEPGALVIGMRLRAVLRKLYVCDEKSIIHYGLKFVPESS